jgi:hypothetical protein
MNFNEPEDITPGIGMNGISYESPDSPPNRQPTVDSSPPGSSSFKSESVMSSMSGGRRMRRERGGSIGDDGRGTPVNATSNIGEAPSEPAPAQSKGQVPKLNSRYQTGDVILLSGDGVLFKVHRSQVSLN